jgi:hypothetical protein
MAGSGPEQSPGRGDDGLAPEFPQEAGVEVPKLPIEKVESERLLENEGEPDDVIAWIRERERPAGRDR